MTKPDPEKPAPDSPDSGSQTKPARARVPGYKKILLAISLALAGAGLGMHVVAAGRSEAGPAEPNQSRPFAPVKGFLPTNHDDQLAGGWTDPAQTQDAATSQWYPQMFRLGFSFFVGFCIAYALRVFFKLAAFGAGMVLLLLFGLQYAGIISVDWSAMGGHYDTLIRWLGAQVGSMRAFITGYLPSTATASAGLIMGFRQR